MNASWWWRNSKGELYVLVQALLILLVVLGPPELPGLPRWDGAWHRITVLTGLMLVALGALVMSAAAWALGQRNLTAFPRPPDEAMLVTTGPYALVRHPIYSGVSLMAIGWALARASSLTLVYAVLLILFLDVKARREEQWLRERFPQYAAYQQQVKKLIPFIY